MIHRNFGWLATGLCALFTCAASVQAKDIGGTISTTLTITEDSQLVDDVTCTVVEAACIAFGASGITLDLNGFSMTGLGDAETGCSGGRSGTAERSEDGISAAMQRNVTVRGPGLVRRFRAAGFRSDNSSGVTVTGATFSTNCLSGILVGGGSDHRFEGNIAVGNGNSVSPCGGI